MKQYDITPYCLHEELIADHRTDGLRAGEGCVAPLANGDLLLRCSGGFYLL